jgi:hypothetical protein
MTNLLEETREVLQENGVSASDVQFVSDGENAASWAWFIENSNFEYDSGFGLEEINLDLVIVGTDWWLERHEYDGAEGWHFKRQPSKPDGTETTRLRSNYG